MNVKIYYNTSLIDNSFSLLVYIRLHTSLWSFAVCLIVESHVVSLSPTSDVLDVLHLSKRVSPFHSNACRVHSSQVQHQILIWKTSQLHISKKIERRICPFAIARLCSSGLRNTPSGWAHKSWFYIQKPDLLWTVKPLGETIHNYEMWIFL